MAETSRFDFSIRLGAISSANILLETSMAKTISTPSLFTVSNCVPIFGFISPNIRREIEKLISTSFNIGLKRD